MKNYSNKYDIVADIYDFYVNTDYDYHFWLNECSQFSNILELTAGTGRLTIPLAKAGIKVTALDISSSLLSKLKIKANKEGLDIEIINDDIRTFELNKLFPLIIIPFQSIHELTEPEGHSMCFKQVRKHLSPNGKFIITTHNFHKNDEMQIQSSNGTEFTHPITNNKILFSYTRQIDSTGSIGTSIQSYEEYDGDNNLLNKTIFENKYYIFRELEIENLVLTTGFEIVNIWGDYDKSPFNESSKFKIFELKCKD